MSAPQPSAEFLNGPVGKAVDDYGTACYLDYHEAEGEVTLAALAAVEAAVKEEVEAVVQRALADHHCARCDGCGECRRDGSVVTYATTMKQAEIADRLHRGMTSPDPFPDFKTH